MTGELGYERLMPVFRRAATALVLAGASAGVGCARLGARPSQLPPALPAASPDGASRELERAPPLSLASEDDAVVRVVADGVTCTGTLIEEDQVLTAHHCVSARDARGDMLPRDVEPERLRVELGGDYLPWGEVRVRAVVAPACGYAANRGDIAILVLERRLTGVATRAPALEHEPRAGEEIRPVGFGRCARSADGIRRRQRLGGPIGQVDATRFRVEASICPGDSGGPALDLETGAVVGVISRSVMDTTEQTTGPSVFTRLDRWRPVFAAAKLVSEGASLAELPPIAGCE